MLLDGDPAGVAGSPPDSSFDVAVRAAGSILRAQVRSGRRCVLAASTPPRGSIQVHRRRTATGPRRSSCWRRRSPTPQRPAAALLRSAERTGRALARARGRHLAGRARARRPAAAARARAARRLARLRRGGELRGRPAPAGPELLRLQAAGVPVAVVRRGDDLGSVPRAARARRRRRMGRAGRTIAVSAPALVVVALAWLRLEQPVGSLPTAFALLVLALAAALPRGRWTRLAAAVVATVVAARIAVGVDLVPWRLDRPAAPSASHRRSRGSERASGTGSTTSTAPTCPFDPRVHVAMHELVLSGDLRLRARRRRCSRQRAKPVGAALVLLLGAGWPATLLGPSRGIAMGAAILGGALVLLAGLRSRRLPALAFPAGVVVAAAAIVVGSAAAARHGLVHWQTWNVAHVAIGPTDVGFVWNAQYGGLRFSGHPTNVLQVQSAAAPTYLRATVLDDFTGQRVGGRVACARPIRWSLRRQASGEPDPAGRDRRCARRHPPRRRQHPDARSWPPAAPRSCGRVRASPRSTRTSRKASGTRPGATRGDRARRRSGARRRTTPRSSRADGLLTVGRQPDGAAVRLSEPDRRGAQARHPGTRPPPVRPARAARGPADPGHTQPVRRGRETRAVVRLVGHLHVIRTIRPCSSRRWSGS